MERKVGNQLSGTFDQWATGYNGDFYVASFVNKPDYFQWKFYNGKNYAVNCNVVNDGKFDCTCENIDNFEVSCTKAVGTTTYNTTIKLLRTLNDGENAQISIRPPNESNDGSYGDGKTKTIFVTGRVLKKFFQTLKISRYIF